MLSINVKKDIPASISVFLVALPLCLGIALASEAPLISGLVAGMVGGLVVGSLSGSHVSVSGPAAGLVAIIIAAIADLGSYQTFLVAVMLAGVIQLGMGLARAGGIAYYIPKSVIRGLLAAIGLILILKQIPHAVGWDADAEGDFSFFQSDDENTFSELWGLTDHLNHGAMLIALLSFILLALWKRSSRLKRIPVPAELVVVIGAVILNQLFHSMDSGLWIEASHRVALPEYDGLSGFLGILPSPEFSALSDPAVYRVAITLAAVASLETLLNLEAADNLDKHKRVSPPNRELLAQGAGNIVSGSLGGLPVTSVVVRSSVNAYSGAETRFSSIAHGAWLLLAILFFPDALRLIPLAALAAILIYTGLHLASPEVFRSMWRRGWSQFLPFLATVLAIVFTDLLIGVLIGLAVGIFAVVRNVMGTTFLGIHEGRRGENSHILPARFTFAQNLTFLHRAQLIRVLRDVPDGSSLVLDASKTETIDQDLLEIIIDFHHVQAPERGIELSLVGFDHFDDELKDLDVFTKARQAAMSPLDALDELKQGNERFVTGKRIDRSLHHQIKITEKSQHPIAAVLGCIDSRAPHELIFDQGLGDLFSARVAGNVINDDIIASLEYAAAVAEVKVMVVLGHTGCGAVNAACDGVTLGHITGLLKRIQPAIDAVQKKGLHRGDSSYADEVSHENVLAAYRQLMERSELIRERVEKGSLMLIPAMYQLATGRVEFYEEALAA